MISVLKKLFLKTKTFNFQQWIILILAIKLPIFIFYAIHFHLYPEVSFEHGLLYVKGGDTFTYYPPIINFLNGGDYGNACRMPGLAPIFMPFYIISESETFSFNSVIVVQFIISTISVYVLGLISRILFQNSIVFLFTVILYSFYYHIADHYLMADSIANSTIIFGTYYLLLSFKNKFASKRTLFLSGLFFGWSIFTRLIAIVPFIAIVVLLAYFFFFKAKDIKKGIIYITVFISTFAIFETSWVVRNKVSLNRIIFFTVPECYSSYSYNWLELTKIPAAWGYETTPWAGEIDWWLNEEKNADAFPYSPKLFTTNFNADSLFKIKKEYFQLKKTNIFELNIEFKNKINNYLYEYKKQNSIDYYITNPLKLLFKFYIKKSIVDIPFPELSKMNVFQKAIKLVNWIYLIIIALLFLFTAPVSTFIVRKIEYTIFMLIPISISVFLVFIPAIIEQRYLWPIIPFAIVYFAFIFCKIFFRKITN